MNVEISVHSDGNVSRLVQGQRFNSPVRNSVSVQQVMDSILESPKAGATMVSSILHEMEQRILSIQVALEAQKSAFDTQKTAYDDMKASLEKLVTRAEKDLADARTDHLMDIQKLNVRRVLEFAERDISRRLGISDTLQRFDIWRQILTNRGNAPMNQKVLKCVGQDATQAADMIARIYKKCNREVHSPAGRDIAILKSEFTPDELCVVTAVLSSQQYRFTIV